MDVQTAQVFFATLAIIANLATIALVVARLAHRSPLASSLLELVGPYGLWLAWLVALTCTLGSLYFSEVANFTPCTYCWYQRIAMYPLVVIFAIAAARRETAGALYAAGLAAIGAVISAYHVALEWFPALDSGTCDPDNPCTLVWFRAFGLISLPTLALAAFLLILTFSLIRLRRSS